MFSFSVGRATALVLDSGGSTTSAVPVYDGYVLKKGVIHQSIGGEILSQQIRDYIKKDLQLEVTPLYKIASKKPVPSGVAPQLQLRKRHNTTKSFDDYQISVNINRDIGSSKLLKKVITATNTKGMLGICN